MLLGNSLECASICAEYVMNTCNIRFKLLYLYLKVATKIDCNRIAGPYLVSASASQLAHLASARAARTVYRGSPTAFESELVRRLLPKTIDGRTKAARRLVGLIHRLSERVEDPADAVTRSRLTAAAMLMMVSEGLAHRAAAGEEINADEAVRVSNALDRALTRLGMNGS